MLVARHRTSDEPAGTPTADNLSCWRRLAEPQFWRSSWKTRWVDPSEEAGGVGQEVPGNDVVVEEDVEDELTEQTASLGRPSGIEYSFAHYR